MKRNGNGVRRPPNQPQYTLYVDDSDDSKAAFAAMEHARLPFVTMYSTSRKTPSVETGYGVYRGLAEIRAYVLPDPEWAEKGAEIARRFDLKVSDVHVHD